VFTCILPAGGSGKSRMMPHVPIHGKYFAGKFRQELNT
jgi:hypothetical protein